MAALDSLRSLRPGRVQSVLVYWGTIESSRVNKVTKLISWTPLNPRRSA